MDVGVTVDEGDAVLVGELEGLAVDVGEFVGVVVAVDGGLGVKVSVVVGVRLKVRVGGIVGGIGVGDLYRGDLGSLELLR